MQPRARYAGAEAAAACRSLRHRSPGADHRAGAETRRTRCRSPGAIPPSGSRPRRRPRRGAATPPQPATGASRSPIPSRALTLPDAQNAPPAPARQRQQARRTAAGVIADAIRNVQRYAQKDGFVESAGAVIRNSRPSIQFDTKGVEFGPWLRRFIAQIRRNWFIPYAAMSMRGHVVVTFYVHKDGRITDVQVLRPSPIDAFNRSAQQRDPRVTPTQPLPPEYPDDKAFFTVTFFFNEAPAARTCRAMTVARLTDAADRPARRCWPRWPRWRSSARSARRDAAPAARRHPRADRHRQERARHRARAALRRRDRQLRFDGGLPRLRHRHRQGARRSSAAAFRIT